MKADQALGTVSAGNGGGRSIGTRLTWPAARPARRSDTFLLYHTTHTEAEGENVSLAKSSFFFSHPCI